MSIRKIGSSLVVLGLLSSCSFSTPDYKQQQELSARGSFSGGTPPWVLHPRQGIGEVATPQSGLMRTSYATSQIGRDFREPERQATDLPQVTQAEVESRKAGGKKSEPAAVGLLNKLVEKCPFVEDKTRETLLMEDSASRISSWNALISQCPSGSALYYWLGQDYENIGKLAEAGRNYEQAITLDHLNVDAAAALDELRKKQQLK